MEFYSGFEMEPKKKRAKKVATETTEAPSQKEIEWSRIKTGSKVMIQYTDQICGDMDNIDRYLPVDVVFWKTPHFIVGNKEFRSTGSYPSYCTFHQHGKYVLFASHEDTDYVTEVVEY